MQVMSMDKQIYITEEERQKCRDVMEAFAEFYKQGDVLVLDAEKYGFVKLQYYIFGKGFDVVETFTDSKTLFTNLWNEWRDRQLFSLVEGTEMEESNYSDIFKSLTKEKQKEFMEKKLYFQKRAKMIIK